MMSLVKYIETSAAETAALIRVSRLTVSYAVDGEWHYETVVDSKEDTDAWLNAIGAASVRYEVRR